MIRLQRSQPFVLDACTKLTNQKARYKRAPFSMFGSTEFQPTIQNSIADAQNFSKGCCFRSIQFVDGNRGLF